MTELPILVKRFDDKHPGDALACSACGFTRKATEDECMAADWLPGCDRGCLGLLGEPVHLDWKYAEADECEGCGKLGWFGGDKRAAEGWTLPAGVCSRRCQLVAEHKTSLAKSPQEQA